MPTSRPAYRTSRSTRRTPASSTPPPGAGSSASPGTSARGTSTAGSTNRSTVVTPGTSSPGACPVEWWARPASPSRRPIQAGSSSSSSTRPAAGSTAPTTPAPLGSGSARTTCSTSAPGTTCTSPPTPKRPGHGVDLERLPAEVDRRRQELRTAGGATSRPSRAVDQSRGHRPDDQRQRRRRRGVAQRRQDLVDAAQSADRRALYRVSVGGGFPYRLYGAQQDNSTISVPSRLPPGMTSDFEAEFGAGGCESGHIAVDSRNPDVIYAGCYGGGVTRLDRRTGLSRDIIYPQLQLAQDRSELKYRVQCNAPIRISPHDPATIYHTSQYVHRSRDEGHSWEVISPDLTIDNPDHQGYAGGPITRDGTGVEGGLRHDLRVRGVAPRGRGAVGGQRRRADPSLARRRWRMDRRYPRVAAGGGDDQHDRRLGPCRGPGDRRCLSVLSTQGRVVLDP